MEIILVILKHIILSTYMYTNMTKESVKLNNFKPDKLFIKPLCGLCIKHIYTVVYSGICINVQIFDILYEKLK